jgi:(p)ppGpp synthase/HD superfamily hydrolase
LGIEFANVVTECSDTDREPKPPWRERKERYLAHLPSASTDALLVSIADKLHNVRSILADYRRHKENLWMRFNAGKEEQFWYYGELVRVFTQRRPEDPLVTEFARLVKELKDLSGAG